MPTVTLNKAAFLKLVGRKLSDDMLKDRISMLGTSVEDVTKDALVVEVFPNRPDLLSEAGLARALAAFLGMKKGLRNYKAQKSGARVIVDASVKAVRPYTACAIVKNLRVDAETLRQIIQMQEKLHVTYGRNRKKVAIGIYPLDKITMPIRYCARKPADIRFTPLDAKEEMSAREILEAHPTGKAYAHLLRDAKAYPLFVDAKGVILSMPPILNSEEAGHVTEATRDVFIECSGHELPVVETCLTMLVTALADLGGDIMSIDVQYGSKKVITPNVQPRPMQLDLAYVHKILGVSLRDADVKMFLERMGYKYDKGRVLVPAYRADILHEIDLVEDIGIAYGYERFAEEIPKVATIAEEDAFDAFRNKVCDILVGYGLLELNTYNLTSDEELTAKMGVRATSIELANALTQEYGVLRSWVLPSVLRVLQENTHHEYPQQVFTTGAIFKEDQSTETGVHEQTRLVVALCEKDANFTKVKQVLDGLGSALGVQAKITTTTHESFIAGRVGRVSVLGKEIAYIGEIHPTILEKWHIEMPVAALELNLTELYRTLIAKR